MYVEQFTQQLNLAITPEGHRLIQDFFICFSRFECALKAAGFIDGGANRAWPNWDTFVASIEPTFVKGASPELRNAVDYILLNPPRIQTLQGGQLVWQNRVFEANEPEICKLGKSIRDIRNNLFHGGKFHGKFEDEVSRNSRLLSYSLIVLDNWLGLSDPVRVNYLTQIT